MHLALQAMQNDPKLSLRAVVRIYSVDHQKLSRRRRGQQSRRDIPANLRKLTDLEESVIVQYILDLDSKGFPPRLSGVEDIANRLLTERDAQRVGVNWASTFVKRHPELTTRFIGNTTTRGLNAKIQILFAAGLRLYGTQSRSTVSRRRTSTTSTRQGFRWALSRLQWLSQVPNGVAGQSRSSLAIASGQR